MDHHHGQPSGHEIPMRRSPRARRSSLSVADISPSHGCRAGSWARCSLHSTLRPSVPSSRAASQRSYSRAPVTCCGGAPRRLRPPNNSNSALRQTLPTRQEQHTGQTDRDKEEMCCECDTAAYPLPPRRERRRRMKRETSRKHSAQDRINMNRFWNEMEEFYSRQQEEKTEEWRCDWEVEQAMMVVRLVDPGQQEEESDRISCYSSASSSFSGTSSSTPSSPNNLFSPLPVTSEVVSCLPMPPSIPQTRALLSLVERMQTSRISTAV